MFAKMPNSDDQILFLNKGLRAREQRAMKRLVAAADNLSSHPAQTTARVIAFTGAAFAGPLRRLRPAEVIPLANRHAGRTKCTPLDGRFGVRLPETTA